MCLAFPSGDLGYSVLYVRIRGGNVNLSVAALFSSGCQNSVARQGSVLSKVRDRFFAVKGRDTAGFGLPAKSEICWLG